VIKDSGDPGYVNRILIGTATTGLLRIEWVGARYGAVVPVNWSHVGMTQGIPIAPTFYPLRYMVDDAQNLIVKEVIEKDFEWLFLLEHDVVINENTFMILNEYMQGEKHPIVSGLYFTRAYPSQPLIFRGRGTSYYTDWKMGDKVYCDGIPTGCLLIHSAILRAMWDDSPEYMLYNMKTRRVFWTPRKQWKDPESGYYNTTMGTSDLDWCTRVIEGDYIRKAGWGDYMDNLPDPKYPFLVDTNIFCRHINPNGEMFP